MPDISEPKQEKEKRASKDDKLATKPALAFAYHVPKVNTPEYYAMGLLEKILLSGKDSRLYQALVQKNGLTGAVNGGINELGNQFNIKGPVLFTVSLFHDKDKTPDQILRDKGTYVIPDVMANAGGVVVSYFEWVQNLQHFRWEEREVNDRLGTIMRRAFREVSGRAKEERLDLREASYLVGIERVVEAAKTRGYITT